MTNNNLSTANLDIVKALHCEHVIYAWVHADLVNYRDASLLRTDNTSSCSFICQLSSWTAELLTAQKWPFSTTQALKYDKLNADRDKTKMNNKLKTPI